MATSIESAQTFSLPLSLSPSLSPNSEAIPLMPEERDTLRYCIPSTLTRDGRFLIAGSEEENRVFKWDLQTRQVIESWIAHKGETTCRPRQSVCRD